MTDARLAALAGAPVPELRQDLRVSQGARRADGAPTFVIYDPLQHRYHEIDAAGRAMLDAWRPGATFSQVAEALAAAFHRPVELTEVVETAQEFDRLGLLTTPLDGSKSVLRGLAARRKNPASWLLHNYLFMRFPLVRPQAFLRATLPFARMMASRPALIALALATLVGLYLASRQWDQFRDAFVNFLTWEGAAGYLAALGAVKVLHELGHGWAAVRYGCRVPTMGVALLVMTPVLYTDVTDAWRLQSRRQRLTIDAAGVLVELAVAGVATLLWALLPDGPARSAAYFVGAVSWTTSLLINLSPLMRFDAYYMLSDALEIPNLQPRAFALMRWRIRELLFDLGAPCPEPWSARRRAFVVAYALAASLYRLFLFCGIALLVYHFAFKLLGILLFAVEIGWFVLRPIIDEMRLWWRMRAQIARRPRSYVSALASVAAAALIVAPLPEPVEIDAVIEPAASQRLTAVYPARVEAILAKAGDAVRQGDVVMRLSSPQLMRDLARAQGKLELNQALLARRAANETDRGSSVVLESEETALRAEIASLDRLVEQLDIRAQSDGRLVDTLPDLAPGRWVGRGEELGYVVAGDARTVRGYAADHAALRLSAGAAGRFVPDDLTQPSRPVRLVEIAAAAATTIEIPYVTTTNGGRIAVTEDRARGALPAQARVMAQLALADEAGAPPGPDQVLRGVVQLEARAESYATRAWRHAAAVLIRETGF
jgi:putative peptide zinc metalloprotease protein